MIEQIISPIPKLKHRSTVVTLADQDEFVTKYEATNDHLADNTVAELNTFATQVNEVKEQINTDSQAVTKTIEETRLIKSQVEQIGKDTSQIKDETSEIKTEVEQIAGAIPEGTINDTTTAKTSVWSSEKVSEELKNAGGEVAFITHSFTANEELTIPLSRSVNGAIVGVQKEVAQTELVNEDWLVSADEFEGELIPNIDISKTTYTNKSFSFATQSTNAFNLIFSLDGLKMFVAEGEYIYQYSLSTAFDISTAIYSNKNIYTRPQTEGRGRGIQFSSDGLKLFLITGTGVIFQYDLTIAYDISTATYANKSFNAGVQDSASQTFTFSPDGLKIFTGGNTNKKIYQYDLSTAFDITTATYSNKSLDISAVVNFISYGLAITKSGAYLLISGSTSPNNIIYQYDLSTAFDISTASYNDKSFSATSQDTNPRGITLIDNDTKLVILGGQNDKIYQYDVLAGEIATSKTDTYQTSTSKTPINTSLWAEINQFIPTETLNGGEINYSFSKDNKESFIVSNGTAERTIAKNDGGVWKYNSNIVYEAETFESASVNDMNVALDEAMGSAVFNKSYDIENVTYLDKYFSVANQDSVPINFYFSDDGTRMFVSGYINKTIFQYNLTIAFDISTAVYSNKSFSVSNQDNNPADLAFSYDGTRMFVLGYTNRKIFQYNLTIAFDISTASYSNKSFDFSEIGQPQRFEFISNGLKLLLVYGTESREYTLSTAYDISTAVYSNKSFDFSTETTTLYGLAFSNDGLKIFINGLSEKTIFQYNLTIAFDISTAVYSNKSFSVSNQDRNGIAGLEFSNTGVYMYGIAKTNSVVLQYLVGGDTSQNIQPPTPFVLDNNINLAITMKSTGTSPTFTNMDINYDAFSKWQEATPNTDYQAYQQGSNDKVTVKALSANNLKVRVI